MIFFSLKGLKSNFSINTYNIDAVYVPYRYTHQVLAFSDWVPPSGSSKFYGQSTAPWESMFVPAFQQMFLNSIRILSLHLIYRYKILYKRDIRDFKMRITRSNVYENLWLRIFWTINLGDTFHIVKIWMAWPRANLELKKRQVYI